MVYALMLDDIEAPRAQARARLDEILNQPLDPEEAEEERRERWGSAPDQMAEVMATEALDIPTYE